ncbi:MAG: NADPH:quinone oxidoreductase family protein [Parasphingopyxis sp.]
MKALLSRATGGPETLEIGELDKPEPKPGEVVVAVKACAINYPDVLMIVDKYQFKPERPFAPGGEVAGVIDAVGEGVEGFAQGDRVIALSGNGGLAEYVAAPLRSVFAMPEDVGFEDASALLLTYGTTIHALQDRGELKEGETLLVLGAAGGVGLSAVEIGKAMGARVIGAVSSEEKAQAVRDAGADDVLIYPRGPFDKDGQKALSQQFKDAVGPNGADVIYDAVGGDYCEPALRSIAWEGRYLVIGFPAGIPKLPLNLTLLKSCDVRGVFWGAFAARDPQHNAANIAALFAMWKAGKIQPKVTEIFAFEQGGEAIARLGDRKAIGKLVVRIAD